MERQSVTSSNIKSIGYDESKQILEVEFLRGSIYQYLNVPANIGTGIFNAASKGKYLDRNIKKAKYKAVQIK